MWGENKNSSLLTWTGGEITTNNLGTIKHVSTEKGKEDDNGGPLGVLVISSFSETG